MPYVLQQGCTIMCPHGGQAQVIPTNMRVKVGGVPALLPTDTFLISGCPFMMGPKPSPCLTIQWLAPAVRTKVNGSPVLLDSSVGICKSPEQIPQGTVQVLGVQRRVQGQ
jgi:hypothetical protein